jgi:serine-type D-Ala-D-Ala carboxypeptidase (penicillin-binding protein 5/6)
MPVVTLSFSDNIKIVPWRILIYSLGFVDSLGDLPEKMLLRTAKMSVLVFFISFFFSGTVTSHYFSEARKVPGYLPSGIVYTFYQTPGSASYNNNVLGAASGTVQRDLPQKTRDIPYPYLTARSAVVIDRTKSKVLFDLNGNERLAPASTTKLMTAIVARDLYDSESEITVPSFCTTIESTKVGWKESDSPALSDLMSTLLIASAGDSACILANNKVSYSEFLELMNSKAVEIGMKNTVFSNPIGLDGVEGTHFSTAHDLYLMTVASMNDPEIRALVAEKEHIFGESKVFNTNRLLWEIPGSIGVKTGTTMAAGEVLIYEYADEDKDVVIIVMGSKDRFTDTRNLLKWAQDSFTWK